MLNRLRRSTVVRSIAGIGSAAAFGHLLGFAVSPVVSRLFNQEDFGQFGLFFGLSNILTTLALLGLQDAVLATTTERDAKSLLKACVLLCLVSSPILGLVSFVMIGCNLFGYGALPAWSGVLIALDIAAISASVLFQVWLIRRTMFHPLALGHLSQGATRAGTQVGAGLCGLGFPGLAFSEILTRATVAAVLFRRVAPDFREAVSVPILECVRVAWRFRLFVQFRTPSTLAFNIGTALPPMLITMAYGVSEAGLYTLMFSVIVAPAGFVQKAIGDVFLGHFTRRFRSHPADARRFLLRNAAGLLLLSIPPAVLLLSWGPEIFSFIFGTQWREAGHLASLIVPLFMADMVVGPLGGALSTVNRPDAKLLFDVARIVAFFGAYTISTATGAPLSSMIVFMAWFGVLSYAIYFGLILFGIFNPRSHSRIADFPASPV